MWACVKNETKKLAKPRRFFEKITFQRKRCSSYKSSLTFKQIRYTSTIYETIFFEIYFIKFFKMLTFEALYDPIIGRIKIQICQIPCNLADLSAGF